ncbi:hypothetical protein HZA38_02890 [Candidatus Peregrinibacteria bacterium]|nr:hypothetical protein [Candidatus Peregrinibacteria bacterium]
MKMKPTSSPSAQKARSIRKVEGLIFLEVLLGIVIFGIVITAFIDPISFGKKSISASGMKTRATLIAEEGTEALRNIRDENFFNLEDGTHGLTINAGSWSFAGVSDITDIFTREIKVLPLSDDTKQVTSKVTWEETHGNIKTLSLDTYLSNWRHDTFPPIDPDNWKVPKPGVSIDYDGVEDGWKIQTQGNYAYMVRRNANPDFIIINVSNPDAPVGAHLSNLLGGVNNIAISGNYVFVTSNLDNFELQVIDISEPIDPVVPKVVGTFNAPGAADGLGVFAFGPLVYLVRNQDGVEKEFFIISVADPTHPVELGSADLGNGANSEVVVIGNYAYVSSYDDANEVKVVDISHPAAPVYLVNAINLAGNNDGLTIAGFGDNLLLGRAGGKLEILDISNPVLPVWKSAFNAQSSIEDIALGNNNTFAFLATSLNNNEFQVVDITNPVNPFLFGIMNLPQGVSGVAYHPFKNRVFAATNHALREFTVIKPI